MIIYIGFSTRTHKIFARVFCKKFKHCAPVVIHKNTCEIYQFTNPHEINIIHIQKRDIKILEQYGWKFVKYDIKTVPYISKTHAITCVQFTKKFCGIKQSDIQTPDALLRYITKTHKKI